MSAVDTIYEERVRFPVIRGIVVLFAVLTFVFIVAYLYQRLSDQLGDYAVPLWFSAIVFSAMALLTFFLANLITLSVKMTQADAVVAFGIFRVKISWDNVCGCHLDRSSSFLAAANWGVSLGFVGGQWRRMFNVAGYPRVVLELERGWIREIVFSTGYPEEIIELVEGRIAACHGV